MTIESQEVSTYSIATFHLFGHPCGCNGFAAHCHQNLSGPPAPGETVEGANTNTWWFDQQPMSSRVEHVKLLKMPNLKIFELPMLLHFLVCGSEKFGLKSSWQTCRLLWTWRGSGKSGTVMRSYGKLCTMGAPFWILQLASSRKAPFASD